MIVLMKIMLDTKTQITMKKIITKVSILLLSMIVLSSCNENDNDENIYEGESFVSFNATTSASISEDAASPLTVSVYASVPAAQAESFTLDFTVASSDAVAGTDYSVVGTKTSLSFGPDQYVDTIQIMPIDNLLAETNKTVTITLGTASNGLRVGLPGQDENAKVFTVTISENDCAFTLKEIGDGAFSGSDNVPAGQAGPNSSMILTSFDGTNLQFEGIGYAWITDTAFWDEVIIDTQKVNATVDAIGNITIAEQYMCRTTWNGAVQPDYSVQATGKYISCTKTIELNYDIIQGGAVLRSFKDVITMQ